MVKPKKENSKTTLSPNVFGQINYLNFKVRMLLNTASNVHIFIALLKHSLSKVLGNFFIVYPIWIWKFSHFLISLCPIHLVPPSIFSATFFLILWMVIMLNSSLKMLQTAKIHVLLSFIDPCTHVYKSVPSAPKYIYRQRWKIFAKTFLSIRNE